MKEGDVVLLEDITGERDYLSKYKHKLCGQLYKVSAVGMDLTQLTPLFHSVRETVDGEDLLIYNSDLVATVVSTEEL